MQMEEGVSGFKLKFIQNVNAFIMFTTENVVLHLLYGQGCLRQNLRRILRDKATRAWPVIGVCK